MSALTLGQIQDGRRLYQAWSDARVRRRETRSLEDGQAQTIAWEQLETWLQYAPSGCTVVALDALLAAAESVGRLEKQLERTERVLTAPWSQEIINELNAHQGAENRHPYTCGRSSCRRDHADSILRATLDGWRCDHCDYEQNWAHWHSAYSAVPNLALASLRAQLTAREQENQGLRDGAEMAATAANHETLRADKAIGLLETIYAQMGDLIGDYEDCDDCGDIESRPCRIHGPESNAIYHSLRDVARLIGPCVCGHVLDEHHDVDSTKCKQCPCEAFAHPSVPPHSTETP